MTEEAVKQGKKKNLRLKNTVLIIIVLALVLTPLITMKNAEFNGTDDQAEKAISDIKSDYKPWISPIWEPPGEEIEGLLFALQAAIGAGVIGYGLGYLRGRKKRRDDVY